MTDRHGRFLALGLIVIASLAVHACASSGRTPSRGTIVRVFAPFGPGRALQPGAMVSERLDGRCFAESIATEARPDAWRCMAGNRILDPCFEGTMQGRTALACARSPWEATVVVLVPTEPLPTARRPERPLIEGRPWALELTDGSRCTLLTGATSGVAGMRVNYGCQGGQASAVGDLDRRAPQWRIFVIPADGITMEQASVGTAWY
jgi:hypothetical protein